MAYQSGNLTGRGINFDRRSAREQARTAAPASNVGSGPSQSAIIQFLLLGIVTLAIPASWIVSTELVLPSISAAALGLAVVLAAIAWTFQVNGVNANVNLWDVTGILTLIGCGSGMVSEPEAITQLFTARRT